MKLKKWLALFLAVVLMVSVLPQSGNMVSASEPTGITEAEKPQEEPEKISDEAKDNKVSETEEPKAAALSEDGTTAESNAADAVNANNGANAANAETPNDGTNDADAATPNNDTNGAEADAATPNDSTNGTEADKTTPNGDTNGADTTTSNDSTNGANTESPNDGTNGVDAVTPNDNSNAADALNPSGSDDSNKTDAAGTDGDLETKDPNESGSDSNALNPTEADPDEEIPETTDEVDPSQIPAVMSLLPLEEVRGSLVLNNYSDEQLKAVPVETVLSMLKDRDGKPIKIPDDANIVINYFKDENGHRLNDEYHKVERGGTIDLSHSSKNIKNYTMELIAGKGTQLDGDAVRYIIRVYINAIEENIDYDLYVENETIRSRVNEERIIYSPSSLLADTGLPITEISYYVYSDYSNYKEGDTCYLGINSSISKDPNRSNIKVDVYPMKNFLEYYQNGTALSGAITNQILNQENMYNEGGYKGTYKAPNSEDPLSADNIFCMVYTDTETGAVLAYQGLVFVIYSQEITEISGNIFTYENSQMKNITEDFYLGTGSTDWSIDNKTGLNEGMIDYQIGYHEFSLSEGYPSNAEYYYVLDANDQIEKVVLGHYDTQAAAESAGATDITAQVLPTDRSTVPYGYKANFSDDVAITVFYKNGPALKYYVWIYGTTVSSNNTSLFIRMTGAVGYNDIYSIINDNSLDTYCSRGYQTLLINDDTVDLKKLIPEFRSDNDVKVTVNGTEQISGKTEQDFSNGTIQYTAIPKNNEDGNKNYQVTFVKKENGPKLFVNGPEKREVFLTEYYENRHNILIANVGDEELTGLKVELIDSTHVKLDDYWVVGGENNDKLAAFTTARSSKSYGELANLAKIRLLPDGEGVITGTLKISANGQEPVYIELTGYAGNPKIVTESLNEGVKYVPYSHVVATNNMYDWNEVTFTLQKGKLPEGLELRSGTGEIYGIPKETGEFPITIKANFSRPEFKSSSAKLVLTVKENTNDNVYNASDEGYQINEHIGQEIEAGSHDYVLHKKGDQLFVSNGVLNEFVDLWLNGEKLIEGEDYTKESGSTRITIREQTFENKANKEGSNTLAAEFRVDGDLNNDLKRTAQNFRIDIRQSSKGSGGSSKGSDDSQSGSGGSGGSGSAGVVGTSDSTLVMRIVNASGNPLSGLTVEVHSTPKVTQTNPNGIAVFTNIEGGQHTLYAKDMNGNVIASKSFSLLYGAAPILNGDQITVKANTASTLNVQLEGNVLTFLSLQDGDSYQVLPANTGDTSNPALWFTLFLISCCVISGVYLNNKKKKQFINQN